MIVWLVGYDGKIENLALMRLSAYHKARGDTVRLKRGDAYPELFESPDLVYISCLFRWNRQRALNLAKAWNGRAIIGGTGVDIETLLPAYVGSRLDYSLYGNDRAIGFISRGCIRKCPWCIVPGKEGGLKRIETARDIVGKRKEAIFLDNNFLALDDHLDDLVWLVDNNVAIDFNQGLDARLITPENAGLLAWCKWATPGHKTVRLALDFDSQIPAVDRAFRLLEREGIQPSSIFVYCLIGFSGLESDVKRLRFLRSWNASVFPMGYRDIETGEEPATGWEWRLYQKYRRLLCRMPHASLVWQDFERELTLDTLGDS